MTELQLIKCVVVFSSST